MVADCLRAELVDSVGDGSAREPLPGHPLLRPLALVAASALVVLSGCSPAESEQAKRELALIEKAHGNKDQICAAKRKLADAYLHENNDREYPLADVEAKTACLDADLDRLGS